MKLLIILPLIIFMAACHSNETPQKADQPVSLQGTWKLERMMAGWTNEVTSAEDIGYEEFYTFEADSTFTKFRTNGERAGGTYSTGNNEDGFFVQTFYEGETSLRESCTAGKEYFILEESGMLKGGSLPCDGPALFYEKTERRVD